MKNCKSPFICIYDFMIGGLGLSLFECVVYAIIYSYSKDGVGEFFASIGYIAKRTGYSTRNVQRALATLLKKNLITRTQAECYGKKFNTYSINEETLIALCPNEIQKEEDPRMMSQEEYSKKLRAAAREHFAAEEEKAEARKEDDEELRAADGHTQASRDSIKGEYGAADCNSADAEYGKVECEGKKSEGEKNKCADEGAPEYMSERGGELCEGYGGKCFFSEKAGELLAYTKFTGKKKYIAFGRHQGVLLTQHQHRALLRTHGQKMLARYINQLEEWILNCRGFENKITNHYQILRKKFG